VYWIYAILAVKRDYHTQPLMQGNGCMRFYYMFQYKSKQEKFCTYAPTQGKYHLFPQEYTFYSRACSKREKDNIYFHAAIFNQHRKTRI